MYSQSSENSSPTPELNNEQIHALLNKLSSDEQRELTDLMRTCTTEVTMTRGLPATGLILGSLYIARTRLPAQYHFGPKGWPFYAIMGIASLTVSNLMFMGTCRDRIKPRIDQLWKKYDLAASSTNYEEIRRKNREAGNVPSERNERVLPEQTPLKAKISDSYDYTYNLTSSGNNSTTYGDSFTSYKPLIGETSEFQQSPRVRRPPPPIPSSFTSEDSGFMSGTPSGTSSSSEKNPEQGYTFS